MQQIKDKYVIAQYTLSNKYVIRHYENDRWISYLLNDRATMLQFNSIGEAHIYATLNGLSLENFVGRSNDNHMNLLPIHRSNKLCDIL